MKFFKRKKDKKPFLDIPAFGDLRCDDDAYDTHLMLRHIPMASARSAAIIERFPPNLLMYLFSFVCPQTDDESYEPCEQSAIEDCCPLCDVRDLAHAAMVCKKWRAAANQVIYKSIRIDNVHYCQREAYLAERRKRKSFLNRNADPEDTAAARLRLLSRTLRDDPVRLGKAVRILKIPYMLRESSQGDLSRCLAVLPNVKYVDLPEGLFSDDPAFSTLRMEVEYRCPDLRKMTYIGGSEQSLSKLAYNKIWPNLEVLELTRINMDPLMYRHVISSLGNLRALKINECRNFTDDVFSSSEDLPPMPPLRELILHKVDLTARGFTKLMSTPELRSALRVLNLWRTGIKPHNLQDVLCAAPVLRTLAIHESVSQGIVSGANLIKLASQSLETIRYEISNSTDTSSVSNASSSYYTYLASSILSGGLPKLRSVYVRDPYFPDQLMGLPPPPSLPGFANRPSSSGSMKGFGSAPMFSPGSNIGPGSPQSMNLPPPPPLFGGGGGGGSRIRSGIATNRFSSNNPFAGLGPLTKTLEVFTKDDDALDWSFVKVAPQAVVGRAGNGHGRSASSYGLGTDVKGMGWDRGNARRSIMVSNSEGGFLALPADDGEALPAPSPRFRQDEELWQRPRSSGVMASKGERDLWG